ncbi:hypothetical protein N836_30865 [Leptolyngbya sp. Heron Island J]|nr:hypothetical protein N836_30865 [Leptolyngbya sp. Heron Island J]
MYASSSVQKISTVEFRQLADKISAGWSEGNAKKAASAFSEDVVFFETVDNLKFSGREAIYQYSGGDDSSSVDMNMSWHNLVFDEEKQLGFGEFTFQLNSSYQIHGVASMTVLNGLISSWRQYYVESPLPWNGFVDMGV